MNDAYDIMAARCPSRIVLNRIGARWTVFIIYALTAGPLRFGQLQHDVEGITSKVLSETLAALQRDGLIERNDYGGTPARIEYALTPLGRSLWEPLQAVREWAERHTRDILDAQQKAAVADDSPPSRSLDAGAQ